MGTRKGGHSKSSEWNQEEILQAVVMADSFNERFLPITLEQPRALLPVLNVPLIEYTLEFLAAAGVQEVFVFSSAHSAKIQEHLNTSKYRKPSSPMSVNTIVSQECISVGDALREIDHQALIRSDFILLSGDVISNMKFEKILKLHMERRARDKRAIMTMIFKKAQPGHRSRQIADDTLIAIENSTNQLLMYQKNVSKKAVDVKLGMFDEHQQIQLRYDLLDSYISICSPEVSVLFSDNFDFQDRTDFVKGILDDEVMGHRIYVHILENEYAARISNLKLYDAVSKDIISRWVYPYTPDNNIFTFSSCKYGRNNIYLHQDVILARSAVVRDNVVIDAGTHVGEHTTISASVIGKNCKIGKNVSIEGSYFWGNVIIGDFCNIKNSILCDNVVLKENVTLQEGCIISYGCVLGPEICLSSNSMITLAALSEYEGFPSRNSFDDIYADFSKISLEKPTQQEEWDPSVVGKFGKGRLYNLNDDLWESIKHVSLGNISPIGSDVDDDDTTSEEESEEEYENENDRPYGSSSAPQFFVEVLDSMRRALAEKIPAENIILEINGSKYAYNATPAEVRQSVISASLEDALQQIKVADALSFIKKSLVHFSSLISNYVRSPSDQLELISHMELLAESHSILLNCFRHILHILYDRDVLDEDVIIEWQASPSSSEMTSKIKHSCQPLIDWFQEAESESESD